MSQLFVPPSGWYRQINTTVISRHYSPSGDVSVIDTDINRQEFTFYTACTKTTLSIRSTITWGK
jgi:hypothetical protein